MTQWILEPGHTAASFIACHMMVTKVRGKFGDVHGTMEFDPQNVADSAVTIEFNSANFSTGVEDRDNHLRSADFLDAENHPKITFTSTAVEQVRCGDYKVTGDLTIRGISKEVTLDVRYLGKWDTEFWVGDENKGVVARAGFVATTRINRQDFGVSWQSPLDRGGVVVSDIIEIVIDAEALEKTPFVSDFYNAP